MRVCPINLPVVDWVMNKATKKKELRNYSIDFGVCIFCGNCVEYCHQHLSMTEEYELAAFDRQPQLRQRGPRPSTHQRHHRSLRPAPARTGLPPGR